jgi:hypothetical protein
MAMTLNDPELQIPSAGVSEGRPSIITLTAFSEFVEKVK